MRSVQNVPFAGSFAARRTDSQPPQGGKRCTSMPDAKTDAELRQIASKVATMLPKDSSEARTVLRLAIELIDNFQDEKRKPPGHT